MGRRTHICNHGGPSRLVTWRHAVIISPLMRMGVFLMNVLIQGGGRGIGMALAERALAAGANRLFITARDPQAAPAHSKLASDDRVTFLPLDVTDEASITAACAQIADSVPQLDRVICTAGMLQQGDIRPEKRIADLRQDNLLQLYQVNALGPVLLARELWPLLKGDHRLHFAAISARVGSISDNRLGGWYAYRASKAALNQLMRTLSIELARVNPNGCVATLHPGTVDTNLSKPFQGGVPAGKLFTADHAADCLWQVLDRLGPEYTGLLHAYDGSVIPY
jgi:NAD(P)-dependent dehydrogenase (short-subunit alcohol dehydrogenase family)